MEMSEPEAVTELRGATRRRNSGDGNPVWTLHTGAGDYVTAADYAIGHEVANRVPQTAADEGGPESWVGRTVVLVLTPRSGRVRRWRLADG